jgi:cytochrome c553
MRGLQASPEAQAKRLALPEMNPTRILKIVAALALGLPALAAAQAAPNGDPAAGARKTQMCAGCHGIDGWRTAYPEVYSVPKIAGQHPAYIVQALRQYKNGERSHPSMRAIAASLSDQDMADLAAYYGGGSSQTASK